MCGLRISALHQWLQSMQHTKFSGPNLISKFQSLVTAASLCDKAIAKMAYCRRHRIFRTGGTGNILVIDFKWQWNIGERLLGEAEKIAIIHSCVPQDRLALISYALSRRACTAGVSQTLSVIRHLAVVGPAIAASNVTKAKHAFKDLKKPFPKQLWEKNPTPWFA